MKPQTFRARTSRENSGPPTKVVLRGKVLLHEEDEVSGLKFNTRGVDFSKKSAVTAKWTKPESLYSASLGFLINIDPFEQKIGCCWFTRPEWNKLIKAIKQANTVKK